MALKAALPSMASTTKEMKFYSPNSVGSEDDPISEDNFQLRLSDDEDCPTTEDGDNLISSISKETEDEILNKFKFDESEDKEETNKAKEETDKTKEDSNKTNEGSDKKKEDSDTLKEDNEKKSELCNDKDASEPVEEDKSEEAIKEKLAEDKEEIKNGGDDNEMPMEITEECSDNSKETETENEAQKEEETLKDDNECSEKLNVEIEKSTEKVDKENEKDDKASEDLLKNDNEETKKVDDVEEKEEPTPSNDEDKKSEEDAQKEIFKRQTNDTENLLDILDVKSTDENNLLQELKDPSSSSENSEKDENEEECEDMDNDKMEFDEKVEEETEGPEVDEAMDSIDIEENVLVQEDTSGDAKSIDKATTQKIDFMETDKITENEEDNSKKEVTTAPETTTDGATSTLTMTEISEKVESIKKMDSTKETIKQTDPTNETVENGTKTKENESSTKSVKRLLSETADAEMETATKRIKMLEKKDFYDKPTTLKNDNKPVHELETLNCLVEYMKSNVLTKLSRDNLEQLCLQKMCEAVMDKSEIGELRHQLKVQEQMIEHWRKEVTQLTKQARDLETVNSRLMTDYRMRNEREKPIMPLKITRSVGLQVNPDNFILANRRKVARNVPCAQNATMGTATSPMKQSAVHDGAISNGVADPVTPALTNTAADTSSTSTSASSFIDLTDEDDKKAAATTINNNNNKRRSSTNLNNSIGTSSGTTPMSVSSVKSVATTMVTTTAQSKNYRIVSPAVASGMTVAGTPRLMYVVNSSPVQGILTTTTPTTAPKTNSLLKINTNGLVGQTASMRSSSSVARSQQSVRPVQTVRSTTTPKGPSGKVSGARHPAPLPPTPVAQVSIASRKPVPPKPHLQIRKNGNAIVLSWKMPYNLTNFESIASYQLYAYQETSAPPSTDMWRKVGDIKALALPMACTLTQFADGNKYHFAVRAVDVLKRVGPFSEPGPILL